jgi:hypothetical protein
MSPAELAWLSTHMGHDVSTHKQNYRLHPTCIEITKVGKLLLAIDGETNEDVEPDIDATDIPTYSTTTESCQPGTSCQEPSAGMNVHVLLVIIDLCYWMYAIYVLIFIGYLLCNLTKNNLLNNYLTLILMTVTINKEPSSSH